MPRDTVSKDVRAVKVRGSYVYVVEPSQYDEYSIQLLIPKESVLHQQMKEAIKEVATKAFPGVKPGMLQLPLRDGDEEKEGEEYKGMVFCNVKQKNLKRKIAILNNKKLPATDEEINDYCFSGAYFHLMVSVYSFKGKAGKNGVALSFNSLFLDKKTTDSEKPERLGGGGYTDTSLFDDVCDDFDETDEQSGDDFDDF